MAVSLSIERSSKLKARLLEEMERQVDAYTSNLQLISRIWVLSSGERRQRMAKVGKAVGSMVEEAMI